MTFCKWNRQFCMDKNTNKDKRNFFLRYFSVRWMSSSGVYAAWMFFLLLCLNLVVHRYYSKNCHGNFNYHYWGRLLLWMKSLRTLMITMFEILEVHCTLWSVIVAQSCLGSTNIAWRPISNYASGWTYGTWVGAWGRERALGLGALLYSPVQNLAYESWTFLERPFRRRLNRS